MNFREFIRLHLFKSLIIFVIIQVIIVAIIQNYNHRPHALPDEVNIVEDRFAKILPIQNDYDDDEKDELSIAKISSPYNGKLVKRANLIYYTPNNGFVGVDSFTYSITDGNKESDFATVLINVTKNLAPETNSDTVSVLNSSIAIINVIENDFDKEGDTIKIKDFSLPANGNLKLIDDRFVYEPNGASVQSDSFTYTVSDGKNVSQKALVVINLNNSMNKFSPWGSCDVGNVQKPGSIKKLDNSLEINASGSDIYANNDGFHFVYQLINGDCEMYTKIESFEGSHEWAKAGLMIRESLYSGSRNEFVFLTMRNGFSFQQRYNTKNSTDGGSREENIKAPYWVKITRNSDLFSFFGSQDGIDWKLIGKYGAPMSKIAYIGFAVSSHNNSELAQAVFSNYKLTGKIFRFQDLK